MKKVYLQGDAPSRMLPEDLNKWHVRNSSGEMVPFSAFASAHWSYGSPRLERYNGSSSVEIMGQGAPGVSTGDAMAAVEEIAAKLPPGIGIEWTGVSFEERRTGAQAPALYAISRCSSSSSASPRCTKAGRCHSPSCSSCRSV